MVKEHGKKSVKSKKFSSGGALFVAASRDLLPYLKEELDTLGYEVLSESSGGVKVPGSIEEATFLNLHLRTAHHVLLPLREFNAKDTDGLYREASAVPWEELVPDDGYLCVHSIVDTPGVVDSRYVNLRCKDAVVDRIREKTGKRPDSGPRWDRTVVRVYWKEGRCSLYLDTSGESLAKRSYRKIPLSAPMQETLAAAVVMASRWDPRTSFVNPMCGSGTIAIEAALIALGRAPGIRRDYFGFMHIKGFNRGLWDRLRREARMKERSTVGCRIIATDIDRKAVEAARKNAKAAGVERFIEIFACDFRETPIPEGGGVVVLNPGYGIRVGSSRNLEAVYSGIGDFSKMKCAGYRGYVFSGNLDLVKKVGLRTSRRLTFHNGDIECRLNEYELYEGTKRRKFRESEG